MALFPGVRLPGREADQSSRFDAEVKMCEALSPPPVRLNCVVQLNAEVVLPLPYEELKP